MEMCPTKVITNIENEDCKSELHHDIKGTQVRKMFYMTFGRINACSQQWFVGQIQNKVYLGIVLII